ncbi:MAG: mandelate racemase/muconate lactonizing enzyme family protein, partial [Boseongicola sp.]
MMIKIAMMDAFAISVPLKSPIKMASVVISTADNLIVRITDQDGNIGWGEGASAPTMTGETPESMVAAAKHLMLDLVDKEIGDLKGLHHELDRLIYGNHGSKAAIDMALHDLLGKRTGQPLYQLLGGKVRDDVPIITMVAGGDLETEIANAQAQAAQGFVAFKVKVGVNPPARDLERARAIREAVGPKARVSADANQGYSNEDALIFSEGADRAKLDFMEQLVMGDDLAGMAA